MLAKLFIFFALSFLKDKLQLLGLLRNHLVTGCQKDSSSRKLDINVNKIIVWEENLLLVLLSYLGSKNLAARKSLWTLQTVSGDSIRLLAVHNGSASTC